jgi:hypothetical protein
MIVHIVLGRDRGDLSPQEAAELSNALAGLSRVPGVLSMSSGANYSQRSKGYTHAAVLYFATQDDLDRYQTEELHVQTVRVFDRLMPQRLVVDYETETSGIST